MLGDLATSLGPTGVVLLHTAFWKNMGDASRAPGMLRCRGYWAPGQGAVWWGLGFQNGALLKLLRTWGEMWDLA